MVVLAGLAVLLGAAPASAHASLLKTDPSEGQVLAAAPSTVRFTFDEPIRLQSGEVHVFYADGSEVKADAHTEDDDLDVALPGTLKDGTYVVAWRVISADGHPVAGALTFSIGAPSARVVTPGSVSTTTPRSIEVALAVVQALVYLGLFLCVGLIVFELLVLPAVDRLDLVRARLRRIEYAAAAISIVAVWIQFPIDEAYQRGGGLSWALDPSHWSLHPGDGEVWAAVALTVGLVGCLRIPRAGNGRPEPVALVGAVVALASLALVGHTRSVGPTALVVAADITHVVAGSVWLGGLVGLTIALPRLAARPRVSAVAVAGFSSLAAYALGLVALTGSILAWRILGSWGALFGSDFGITLMIKVALVAVVAIVAAVNRFRVLPAVLADAGHDANRSAADRLRRLVRIEASLLLVVLVVTGVLVDRSPVEGGSRSAVAAPSGLHADTAVGQAAGLRVVLRLKPMAVGANTVTVQLQDQGGNPIEPYDAPTVSFSHGSLDLGDQTLVNTGSGTYRGTVVLPRSGAWTASVTVRTGRFDSHVVPVHLTLR
ncbi:MAG TPA: copper resistance protein CopC [Marmoricola sp.]